MNHTYRLVWNRALSMFVAVSECARAMGKSGGGKAIAGVALAVSVIAAPAAFAHTSSIGYEIKPSNSVQIWYGTYHSETTFTEGSLSFIGDNGYSATVSFTDLVTSKPIGLVDGTTNFFSDGQKLVGTANQQIYVWQGVTFNNLTAGTYTFNYIPIDYPTQDWEPWDNVIRTGSFVITAEALASGGGNKIDTQADSYEASKLPATGTLAFEGGTLKGDTDNATLAQDFTIDTKGGTVDQAGNTTTMSGVLSDAADGVPGALTLTNSGDGGQVILTGTNTYTGGTTINKGATLELAGNGSIAGSSGLKNEGTLVVGSDTPVAISTIGGNGNVVLKDQDLVLTRGADNLAGVVSGNGGVTVAGGTQQLSGANTFTGTVSATSGGTLRVASDANLGAAGNGLVLDNGKLDATGSFAMTRDVTVLGNGAVQVASGSTLSSNGATSGSGRLVKEGAGTLVLGGDNSALSGGVSINGGTLQLASAKAAGSGDVALNAGVLQTSTSLALAQQLGVAGGTTIDTGAGSTLTLAGGVQALGGEGCFIKSGAGTLNVASNGTFGHGVCVNQGEMRANGLIGSTFVAVAQGATLRGSGAINAPITVKGTLAPGNSPGTLSTSSTVVMDAGSTFQADINGTGTASGPGNYSRLIVTNGAQFVAGGATLAPNLVNITGTDTYTPYVPQIGESYRIITADGGVVGRFGTLVQPQGLAADTRMAVFYDGDGSRSVDLRVLPGSYARFAANKGGNLNAQQSGLVADRILEADQGASASAAQSRLAYTLSSLSGERLGQAVALLGGEVHAAMAAVAPLAGQSLQRSVQGQLDGLRADSNSALWADLSGNRTRTGSDATASSFDADRGQLTVGVDAFRNQSSRIGLGFAHARADVDAKAGDGKLRENMLFAYGEQQGQHVTLSAIAGVGRSKWNTERDNPFGGELLATRADGRSALAGIGVSAPWQVGGKQLTPFARVLWQRVERDAGAEAAADPAALSLPAFSATGVRSTVGLAGAVKGAEGSATTLRYSAAIGHDSGSLLRPVVGSSLAGVASFVAAPEVARTFFEGSVSGTVVHNAKTTSFYGVSTELRNGRTDVSLNGGLRYSF